MHVSVSSASHIFFFIIIMSFLKLFTRYPINIIRQANLSTTSGLRQQAEEEEAESLEPVIKEKQIPWERDRRIPIDVETSIRYVDSIAFKKAYGEDLIWTLYRRNHKGGIAPKTRKTCIKHGIVTTGNACPICRDKYIVVHHKNLKLLNQFISPYSGEILPTKKTGVCQYQQRQLIVAITQARNRGLLTCDVPHRYYDYSVYMPEKLKQELEKEQENL